MESAIYTTAPFSIIDKIQLLGSKYILRCVGEFVLDDYIVNGIPMMKRWNQLHEKMNYYHDLPDSYYIEKSGFYGFEEMPKCFYKDGSLYDKRNKLHMYGLILQMKRQIIQKGYFCIRKLEIKWDKLFERNPSQIWLPPYEKRTIYGGIKTMEYHLYYGQWCPQVK
jgi:hypothetical protein